jgi:hypothetical protein
MKNYFIIYKYKMPFSEAKMTRVGINSNNPTQTLKLKYIGEEENVCIYQITGSSTNLTVQNGELFLNKTTNQITLSYFAISQKSGDEYSITCILTKNGKNNWSGSQIFQRDPPAGECGVVTKFSFVK